MHALVTVIIMALDLYWWVLIATAVMSWLLAFNVINYRNEIVRSIWNTANSLTEPVLRPIRRVLPAMGGLDISPVIVLLIISFIRIWLVDQLRYGTFGG